MTDPLTTEQLAELERPMTRGDWVRITTGARERWQRGHGDTMEYITTVLGAWNAYRPNGPLDGEVVPHEVERLRSVLQATLSKLGAQEAQSKPETP